MHLDDDEEVRREEAEVNALLRSLDHPPPRVNAQDIAVMARSHRFGWGRWAAAVLLGLGAAGAAYAAPGSPLPHWVDGVLAKMRATEQPGALHPAPSGPADRGVSGIAVAPEQNLVIVFTAAEANSYATVSLSDGEEVEVRALNADVSLTSDVGRLLVEARGSAAAFEIEIPRAAPRVEIRVGDRRIFLKEGNRITTDAAASGETYLLRL